MLHSLASTDDTALRNLAERYKQSSKIIEDLEDFPVDPHEAMAIRQSLLPTTADPAMWQVKCQVRLETGFFRSRANRSRLLRLICTCPLPCATNDIGNEILTLKYSFLTRTRYA